MNTGFENVCIELRRLEMIQKQLSSSSKSQCRCCSSTNILLRRENTSTSTKFLPYSEREAQEYIRKYSDVNKDLALRCYTSNLIGKQTNLVLHGGGNTSVKFEARNEVFGDRVSVLGVKGSGYGLDTIPPEGFPQLKLKHLHRMVSQPKLTDVQMVKELRANMLDPSSPNPSVETLLHASLPFKFVDHSHADAIVALGNLPPERAREMIARAYERTGLRVGVVKYVMPGFGLAKHVSEVYRKDPSVNCLILLNHGLFTWADTAKESYERHVRCVDLAQRFADRFPPLTLRHISPSFQNVSTSFKTRALTTIRGLYTEMSNSRWYLRHRVSKVVETLIQSEQCEDLVMRGPITPDHVIRSKGWPMVVRFSALRDEEDLTTFLEQKLRDYARNYESYFEQNNDGTKVMLDTLPRVLLLEGIGLVTAGKTIKAVEISADIYEHTVCFFLESLFSFCFTYSPPHTRTHHTYQVPTILSTARMGTYAPVSRDHLFDCEYWELEQRKLRLKKSVSGPLQGHVAIITGGCSGIVYFLSLSHTHLPTHTYTHIYIYQVSVLLLQNSMFEVVHVLL
jgi:rhamnose utilization protein RhaD (predicted bifunctional aldolase and dehydrogenase)